MTGVLLRDHVKMHTGTDTEGESHVVTEAETGVMQLEAKEHQRLLANARTKTRHGGLFLLDFRLLSSRIVRVISVVLSHPKLHFVMAVPGNDYDCW